jgi:hypothetical protein
MKTVTIDVAGEPRELKFTMARAQLLQELTGVDILNDGNAFTAALASIDGVTKALYALAGGERKLGMGLEDFADELSVAELESIGAKLDAVLKRDAPAPAGDEGNAKSPKKGRAGSE